MARRVEIVTECEHGEWVGPHCTMEREGRCPYDPTDTDRECYCPGGSRRVLEPGEYVLVKKVGRRIYGAGIPDGRYWLVPVRERQ